MCTHSTANESPCYASDDKSKTGKINYQGHVLPPLSWLDWNFWYRKKGSPNGWDMPFLIPAERKYLLLGNGNSSVFSSFGVGFRFFLGNLCISFYLGLGDLGI